MVMRQVAGYAILISAVAWQGEIHSIPITIENFNGNLLIIDNIYFGLGEQLENNQSRLFPLTYDQP